MSADLSKIVFPWQRGVFPQICKKIVIERMHLSVSFSLTILRSNRPVTWPERMPAPTPDQCFRCIHVHGGRCLWRHQQAHGVHELHFVWATVCVDHVHVVDLYGDLYAHLLMDRRTRQSAYHFNPGSRCEQARDTTVKQEVISGRPLASLETTAVTAIASWLCISYYLLTPKSLRLVAWSYY